MRTLRFAALAAALLVGVVLPRAELLAQGRFPQIEYDFISSGLECGVPCDETVALDHNDLAISQAADLVRPQTVKMFHHTPDLGWTQVATLTAPEPCLAPQQEPCGDRMFGESLAMSRSHVFVSGDATGVRPSLVYVFREVDGVWQHRQTLVLGNGSGYVRAMAAYEHLLVVAAGNTVYVYRRLQDGMYHFEAQLNSPVPESDSFGSAVATAPGIIVVGANGEDDGRGAAYVFNRAGRKWPLQHRLVPPRSRPGAQSFGTAVAVSATALVVGAPDFLRKPPRRNGLVYVFTHSGVGPTRWRLSQTMTDPYVPAPTFFRGDFGATLAIEKDKLVVGATSGYRVIDPLPRAFLARQQGPKFAYIAEFKSGSVGDIQLSHGKVAISSPAIRYGAVTTAYTLPWFSADAPQ